MKTYKIWNCCDWFSICCNHLLQSFLFVFIQRQFYPLIDQYQPEIYAKEFGPWIWIIFDLFNNTKQILLDWIFRIHLVFVSLVENINFKNINLSSDYHNIRHMVILDAIIQTLSGFLDVYEGQKVKDGQFPSV